MAQKGRSLVSLATGKKTVAKKPEVVVKAKTPEEIRDLKAKETVSKLLGDVNLTPNENANTTQAPVGDVKPVGVEWLQEQVALLASENENLKIELDKAKNDYVKIFEKHQAGGVQDSSDVTNNVLSVFHELQSNYLKNPGLTPGGTPNFIIMPQPFLNRLINYFPFLQNEKRF
jgi:hypothetical protein